MKIALLFGLVIVSFFFYVAAQEGGSSSFSEPSGEPTPAPPASASSSGSSSSFIECEIVPCEQGSSSSSSFSSSSSSGEPTTRGESSSSSSFSSSSFSSSSAAYGESESWYYDWSDDSYWGDGANDETAMSSYSDAVSIPEDLTGSMFWPQQFTAACNTNAAKFAADVEWCASELASCRDDTTVDLLGAACSAATEDKIYNCVADYAFCLLDSEPSISESSAECAWSESFMSSAVIAAVDGGAMIGCAGDNTGFLSTWRRRYFNCSLDGATSAAEAIAADERHCTRLTTEIAAAIALILDAGATEEEIKSEYNAPLPAGIPPIVIYSSACGGNGSTCYRKYIDGKTCVCPSAPLISLPIYVPQFLFANTKDTPCQKAHANLDVCEPQHQQASNISFALYSSKTPAAAPSSARRLAHESASGGDGSSSTCAGSQTERAFQILAPDLDVAAKTPIRKRLVICAEHNTNVFIRSTNIAGSCYEPRDNITCGCAAGTVTMGLPITFINQSTDKAAAGQLVLCSYPQPEPLEAQAVASAALTFISGLSSSAAASTVQLASLATLIDCTSGTAAATTTRSNRTAGKTTAATGTKTTTLSSTGSSEGTASAASKAGGRMAMTPVLIGDSPAGGLFFLLIVFLVPPVAHLLVVLIITALRINCGMFIELPPQERPQLFDEEEEDADGVRNDETAKIEADEDEHEEDPGSAPAMAEGAGDVADNEPSSSSADFGNSHQLSIMMQMPSMIFALERKEELRRVIDSLSLSEHFWEAAQKIKFPGASFAIYRLFFQGLCFETMFLLARYAHLEPWLAGVGTLGLLLIVAVIAGHVYVGLQLAWQFDDEPDTLRERAFTEYKYAYWEGCFWSSATRAMFAPCGYWLDRDPFCRRWLNAYSAWSGRSPTLLWTLPLPLITALLCAIIVASPSSSCDAVYWSMCMILVVNAVVLGAAHIWHRSWIFNLTFVTTSVLAVLSAALILTLRYQGPDSRAARALYVAIVYLGAIVGLVSAVFLVHEFFIGRPYELLRYVEEEAAKAAAQQEQQGEEEEEEAEEQQQQPDLDTEMTINMSSSFCPSPRGKNPLARDWGDDDLSASSDEGEADYSFDEEVNLDQIVLINIDGKTPSEVCPTGDEQGDVVINLDLEPDARVRPAPEVQRVGRAVLRALRMAKLAGAFEGSSGAAGGGARASSPLSALRHLQQLQQQRQQQQQQGGASEPSSSGSPPGSPRTAAAPAPRPKAKRPRPKRPQQQQAAPENREGQGFLSTMLNMF